MALGVPDSPASAHEDKAPKNNGCCPSVKRAVNELGSLFFQSGRYTISSIFHDSNAQSKACSLDANEETVLAKEL